MQQSMAARRQEAVVIAIQGDLDAMQAAVGQFTTIRNRMGMHAVRLGSLLAIEKSMLQQGEWLSWIAKNFGPSERTARVCMQLAWRCNRVTEISYQEIVDATSRLLGGKSDPKLLSWSPDVEAPEATPKQVEAVSGWISQAGSLRALLMATAAPPRKQLEDGRAKPKPREPQSVEEKHTHALKDWTALVDFLQIHGLRKKTWQRLNDDERDGVVRVLRDVASEIEGG